jgi:hypothetical protein
MPHCIAQLFEGLLTRLLPAKGRHRAVPGAPSFARAQTSQPWPQARAARVRPYVLVHERQGRAYQPRNQHRALRMTVHGIGTGSRPLHRAKAA